MSAWNHCQQHGWRKDEAQCIHCAATEREKLQKWRAVGLSSGKPFPLGAYGPGMTRDEAAEAANKSMRSGWYRGGSSDYHNFQMVVDNPVNLA